MPLPMSDPSHYAIDIEDWLSRRWREGYILRGGKTFEEHVRDEQLKAAANRTADSDDGCPSCPRDDGGRSLGVAEN